MMMMIVVVVVIIVARVHVAVGAGRQWPVHPRYLLELEDRVRDAVGLGGSGTCTHTTIGGFHCKVLIHTPVTVVIDTITNCVIGGRLPWYATVLNGTIYTTGPPS